MSLAERVQSLLSARFVRFAAVGAAGFVVDVSVLTALHDFAGLTPYAARFVSIACAMTFTWWGNRSLTFAEHAANGARGMFAEWLKFCTANAFGAVVNYATFALLVALAHFPLNHPWVATAAGVGVGLIFNFTLSKRFVFRDR